MKLNKKSIPNSEVVQIPAILILGGIFIYASTDKILKQDDFTEIIQSYNIHPDSFVGIVSFSPSWLELTLGIFLIVGLFIRESAFILSDLLLVFMIVISIKSANGTFEDSSCFSQSSPLSSSNILFLLIRYSLFVALGAFITLTNRRKAIRKESI